jgi:hypothetical protein
MNVQPGTRAEGHRGRVTISLGIAAIIMFLAAASLAGLALAGSGGPVSITGASVAALTLAVLMAASGIEALRRRHFWFAVLVPAAMALFNLAYALYSGVYEAIVTAIVFGAAAVLVAQSRSNFVEELPSVRPADA